MCASRLAYGLGERLAVSPQESYGTMGTNSMSEKLIPGTPLQEADVPESADDSEEFDFSDLLDEDEPTAQEPQPTAAGGGLSGDIVSVRDDGYFVDIGRKSEAFLPLEGAGSGDGEALALGDRIDCSITGRSPEGYLIVSRIVAQRPKNWTQFEMAFEDRTAIAGTVSEVIKGGLAVDVGERAFLPASRSGARDAEQMQALVGQEIRARIVQLDVADENIILDRRVLLEEEKEEKRKEAIGRLEAGATVRGVVRSIRDFGAFVDLGGVDGLLHVSDLAWSKVQDVASVLSVGQELDVKVLKVEEDGKRISVGLKQLTPDPWTLIAEKRNLGDRVKGVVTRLMDFGAFVELEPGVEGLVHVSEMSWARRVNHPKDLLKVGDVVEAVVLELKPAERRIGLGLKQTLGDPWEKAGKELAAGSVVEGTVRNLAKFGAFIEVLDGIEGLVHISDITSEKRLNHPNEALKTDEKVKAVVLEVDREKRRLKLGIKQLEPDDTDDFLESCKVGDTVTGRVTRVSDARAQVDLGGGVKGVCPLDDPQEAKTKKKARRKRKADVSSLGDMLQAAWSGGPATGGAAAASPPRKLSAGEVHSFRVTHLDPEKRTIQLALS